ncbi:hypothetical protein HY485_01325 [Candidatus Woesearchaeota archaeon]|nr:hypothetical protein [Candidatus Woesearchaeota archaeon]
MADKLDLISGMNNIERLLAEEHLKCINPDDAKYWKTTKKLSHYLSAEAEWRCFAFVQKVLLETRKEFGQAQQKHVDEVSVALEKISPLNMALLEEKVTKHDQLAVIEEIGRFVSPETKALLHPGTTSYDIVDTARSYLLKKAWTEVIRPKVKEVVSKLCDLAEQHIDLLQVGRTHLQDTSPITFGSMIASYAKRIAERTQKCDNAFDGLLGKISGIVGAGASIEVVIGKGKARDFENCVLEKLGLKADPAATQIVAKERIVDVAANISTLMGVSANFANDMRILYSSAIGEVTSLDAAARLGGSSADAGKNNPVNYENIKGKARVVESSFTIVNGLLETNLQRDLCNSVQARYEPQLMMTRMYESYCRLSKALDELSVNDGRMRENLVSVRERPTEAMTAITRAHCYIHPKYGVGHDVVKKFAKEAKISKRKLIDVALEDEHFRTAFNSWPEWHQRILNGELELYLGATKEKAKENVAYARVF